MVDILHDLIWTAYTKSIGILVVSIVHTYMYIHIYLFIYSEPGPLHPLKKDTQGAGQ